MFSNLKKIIAGRDVYVWGAGYCGCSLRKKCENSNIPVKGFIDKNPVLLGKYLDGIKIYGIDIIENFKTNIFLICAVPLNAANMANTLERYNFKNGIDYVSNSNIVEFYIDIVSMCNLTCPSCPRGNSRQKRSVAFKINDRGKAGFMDINLFNDIVDKMLSDEPNIHCLALFNWGEPFLHPHLDKFIDTLKTKNIYSVLSSNLSIDKNFDQVIKSQPDWLKISISGYYQPSYSTTHTGGYVDLVKSNIYRIKYLIEKYNLKTNVEINYHKYKNNIDDDYFMIKKLADDTGFILHDVVAFYVPVERIIDISMGKEVAGFKELNPLFIDESVWKTTPFMGGGGVECSLQKNQVCIDHNGNVALCCLTYDQENHLLLDYLTTSMDVITKAKMKHKFCLKCKALGLSK
jgi:organic radical activating enzyme